ncbi:hypothetical protein [Micromonospora sp. AKA38]|uniref:hypothetical protein n=1 Tax=Micromonospora sp. AKA38 TaxID=2733861 RepID=UPI0024929EC0|nr:hypothetical protein [Micromonospora sp. AKA38]
MLLDQSSGAFGRQAGNKAAFFRVAAKLLGPGSHPPSPRSTLWPPALGPQPDRHAGIVNTRCWSTGPSAEHVPNGATGDSSTPTNRSGNNRHSIVPVPAPIDSSSSLLSSPEHAGIDKL